MNLTDNQKKVLRWMREVTNEEHYIDPFMVCPTINHKDVHALEDTGMIVRYLESSNFAVTSAGRELNLEDE